MSSDLDTFRIKRDYQQDQNRQSYWKRMEFSEEQWGG